MPPKRKKRKLNPRSSPDVVEVEGDECIEAGGAKGSAADATEGGDAPEPEVEMTEEERKEMEEEEERLRIWDLFAEEYHDIVNELPLELHRNFRLMSELEDQMQTAERQLEEALLAYVALTQPPPPPEPEPDRPRKDDEKVEIEGQKDRKSEDGKDEAGIEGPSSASMDVDGDVSGRPAASTSPAREPKEPVESLASAEPDPEAEAGSQAEIQASLLRDTEAGDDDGDAVMGDVGEERVGEDDDVENGGKGETHVDVDGEMKNGEGGKETETEVEQDVEVSAREQEIRKLLDRIATLTRTAVKKGEDKFGLAVTMYDWVDRHIRRLDSDLVKYEDSISLGLRNGTRPSKEVSSVTDVAEPSAISSIATRTRTRGGSKGVGTGLGLDGTSSSATGDGVGGPSRSAGGEGSGGVKITFTAGDFVPERTTRSAFLRESAGGGGGDRPPNPTAAAGGTKDPAAPKKISFVLDGTTRRKIKKKKDEEEDGGPPLNMPIDPNEPKYCYCNQVSYGHMVACDNDDCEREWFHLGCVGLTGPPKGRWFCRDCGDLQRREKKRK